MTHALIPVFSLIVLGVILRWIDLFSADVWRGMERLTYYILFPCLLFLKLASASITASLFQDLVVLLISILTVTTIVLVLLGRVLKLPESAVSSFFQGGIRFNTYVGLAVVAGLMGEEGLAIAAAALGVLIPTVNLLCIAVFAYTDRKSEQGYKAVVQNILTNPLILACVTGTAWSGLSLPLPVFAVSFLELLSAAALPLGLLAVGAGVGLKAITGLTGPLVFSSVVKLLVVPLFAYGMCRILEMPSDVTAVTVILGSLPTASSAYILARQLGGDANLMATIISSQTLLAMASMPVVLAFLL